MALNHYVSLGRSGLRVSPLSLGTMTFGKDWGWGSSVEDSYKILSRYVELGGNFLDTANLYTKGHSEKVIGDFIKKEKIRRDQLVLATKFYGNMYSGDPNGGGASRKSMHSAVDKSLKRLQTDYIDLYWMHCWDRFTPIEETMSALNDLVQSGKVRYIGFSDTPAWKCSQAQTIAHFRGWSPLIALQIEYSLIERTVEGELVPMAQEMGLGITPWSPLKGGILTGKYKREEADKVDAGRGDWVTRFLTEKNFDIVDVVKEVAEELDTTPARVALAWVQKMPGVTSSIFGATSLKQLDDNVAALDIELTEEQMNKLNEVSAPELDFPAQFIKNAGPFGYGGTTINGESFEVNPLAPTSDAERHDEELVTA